MSESAAYKSLEVLKQISSTGYLRKRMPQELIVLQGGQAHGGIALSGSDPVATLQTLVPETTATATLNTAISAISTTTSISSGAISMDARTKAKIQGYEGEACNDCGNYTLVRNGTCMKCNTCGGTSGCS